MHVQPLFPSYLASEVLEPGTVNNDRICEAAYELRGQHRDQIFHGGYQSPDLEVNWEPAQDLLDVVQDRAQGLWSRLLDGVGTHEAVIDNWWINIQEPGGDCFPPHVHKGHVISFVYYARATEGAGTLNFIAPFQGMEYATPIELIDRQNPYTSARWAVDPEPGLLVAFPSYLMHWVENNHAQYDRISCAFNIEVRERKWN
jgi:uncharacterized protein (TIGR02466 family)